MQNMQTTNQDSEGASEEDLIIELENVREEEHRLRRELESLMPGRVAANGSVADEAGRVCRRERLRGELLPQAHIRRLELEAEVASRKARSLSEEAAPSRRRLEEAGAELAEARREWAGHERSISRARWQAERLREHARKLEARERQV